MAIYTYEVDHGDDSPRIFEGMELNGGKVSTVRFDAALDRLVEIEEAATTLIEWYCENVSGTEMLPCMKKLKELILEST